MAQVAVNYSASSGAAEEVASQIKAMGGDAICVKANCGKVSGLASTVSQMMCLLAVFVVKKGV